MNGRLRYNEHLEVLLALVTYLALTGWRSRAPYGLARDLGLEEVLITRVLDGFPGLFRKGTAYDTDVGPQRTYTLHARYALRRPRDGQPTIDDATARIGRDTPDPSRDGRGEEVSVETLRALLDFVSEQARAERDSRTSRSSQIWVVVGVSLAAAASIVAAIIQATG